jgi:lysophospholipid acyltransferase (LPLAT)-like uncharacterized protein
MPKERMNAAVNGSDNPGTRPVKRSGRLVVPHEPRWFQRLAAFAVYALIRSVAATLRYRVEDRSGLHDGRYQGAAIYCVWHNRLPLCLIPYRFYARKHKPTPGMAAIVSASKDGGFLAAILECFKVQPVRGSSSRRGPQALLELTTWAERGYDLAITPDGPRGPRYVVQEGATSLAQITGLPIVPASFNVPWKIQLKSWDRLQIPLPLSRCEVILGEAVAVPREATDEERQGHRQKLQRILNEITRD